MKVNAKVIQLASEGLIPLLGFFLWNWSLYFILLFYFIDLLANEVILHLKSKKTIEYRPISENKTQWLKHGVSSSVTLTFVIVTIHLAMYFIAPGIDFANEAIAFWNYEEMGIKQGYILVPLMVFVGYQQYKMEFLMPAKFRTTDLNTLWVKHIKSLVMIIGFAGFCFGLSQIIVLPEIVFVLGIILFTTVYKMRYGN